MSLQFWGIATDYRGDPNHVPNGEVLKRIRFRPTYSNVVATLALFFALAGGAWAATQLPKESVGSTQLAKGAVTPAKLSAEAKKGFTGARGAAGPQGALGPRGAEGPRGENGAAGATGPQGIRGATGTTGATGSRGEMGERGLRGEIGAQGDQGVQGVQGIPGERGLQGDQGIQGDPGIQGEPGAKGEKGDQGIQGEPGAKGDQGIQGDPGEKGEKGEPGAEGKTGPTGPSDAYFDLSESGSIQVGNEAKVVLEVTDVPAGEYVLQAAFTLQGVTEAAVAECQFVGGSGITAGTAEPFSTSVTPGGFVSLAGMGTATGTESGTVSVICGTPVEGSNFIIPPESGHLTVTKVGTLHPQAP
jgi:hypothetical protein